MAVYLIRHGKSVDDVNGFAQRDSTPLHNQYFHILDKTKDSLKGFNKGSTKVYSSNVLRARQTAKYLFLNTNIEFLNYIYEYRRPKLLYGLNKDELTKFWNVDHSVDKFDSNWRYDGSESFNDILLRVKTLHKFLSTLPTDQNMFIVGHGTFFKHFIGYNDLGSKYTTKDFFTNYMLLPYKNGQVKSITLIR